MKPGTWLDEEALEVHNAEYRISTGLQDFAALYLYRGELFLTGDDDEDGQWLMRTGDDLVMEVYDRAGNSIWFEIPRDAESAAVEFVEAFHNPEDGSVFA